MKQDDSCGNSCKPKKTVEQLVAALREEYEVDEETAYQHVQAFTNKLKEEGYLE